MIDKQCLRMTPDSGMLCSLPRGHGLAHAFDLPPTVEVPLHSVDYNADREAANNEFAKLRAEVEQLRVQLAGCGVAAYGGTSKKQVAEKGSYGWSDSYQATLDLRRKYDALFDSVQNPKVSWAKQMQAMHKVVDATEVVIASLRKALETDAKEDVDKLYADCKAYDAALEECGREGVARA